MAKEFKLSVDGQEHGGWKSLQVTRSLEELAGRFMVGYTQAWADHGDPLPIELGQACKITYDGRPVITGYVDEDHVNYSAGGADFAVEGRAKTADLVDCSAVATPGQWRNTPLLSIASELCEPFGITCSADSSAPISAPFRRFSIQTGETVFETLDRGARMRSVIMTTDTDGNLVFTRAGSDLCPSSLEYGKNILQGARLGSYRDRFSAYTVLAQTAGDDKWYAKKAAQATAQASDSGISRTRPLVLLGEDQETGTALENRAKLERNVRAGRSKRLQYTVEGWEHERGGLWTPNTIVRVTDDLMRINADMLIVSVTHLRNAGGTITELELMLPEAFGVSNLPTVSQRKDRWISWV